MNAKYRGTELDNRQEATLVGNQIAVRHIVKKGGEMGPSAMEKYLAAGY